MKRRNPIAKAVKNIRPKIIPDKRKRVVRIKPNGIAIVGEGRVTLKVYNNGEHELYVTEGD